MEDSDRLEFLTLEGAPILHEGWIPYVPEVGDSILGMGDQTPFESYTDYD